MSSRQRRRKKHRGTQAGTVRQRSRRSSGSRTTGDKPLTSAEQRRQRLERPPSWRAAANRAGISAAVFFAVLILILKMATGAAIGLALFMLVIYIPMGYTIDSVVYRVRQRRKQRSQAEQSG